MTMAENVNEVPAPLVLEKTDVKPARANLIFDIAQALSRTIAEDPALAATYTAKERMPSSSHGGQVLTVAANTVVTAVDDPWMNEYIKTVQTGTMHDVATLEYGLMHKVAEECKKLDPAIQFSADD